MHFQFSIYLQRFYKLYKTDFIAVITVIIKKFDCMKQQSKQVKFYKNFKYYYIGRRRIMINICANNNGSTVVEIEITLKNLANLFVFEEYKKEKEISTNNQTELIECLGLKDKNGQIIHFGDILKDRFENLLTPVIEISNAEHILFFKPIQHLNKNFSIGCKSTYSHTLEIVGNIYESSRIIEKC